MRIHTTSAARMSLMKGRRFAGALAAATMLVPPALLAQEAAQPQPEETVAIAERQSVRASDFMVTTAHPLATQAGYDVLLAGGNAADAAVAVQAVLGLVEPQSSGIGGGAFLLYYDAGEDDLVTIDAREKAPLAATPDYWLDETGEPLEFIDAVIGGRSAGVPGTPLLLERMHAMFGEADFADLLAPAIALAEEGFEVSPRLAASIAGAEGLDRFEATRAYFFDEAGAPLAAGTMLENPDYAATLRLLAQEGAEPFYSGAIAEDIVAAVQTEDNPGMLTLEDMAAYDVVVREPVCADYRAYEVCGMGPPSSGALTVGQILGQLERFDLAAIGEGPEFRHLFAESARLAFADRARYIADTDFVDMPEGLLDPAYLESRSALIDPETSMGVAEAGDPPWDEARLLGSDVERPRLGTSHFSIVDAAGNIVSMTTTIESGFGNRVMTNGFLLNNELTDFSFAPEADGMEVANRVEGGKRPRSSMAPTIVFEDDVPVLVTGSPGGAAIIHYVALSVISILDFGMDPQAAIDLPHVTNLNGPTRIEEGEGAEALAEALTALGHETAIANLNSGLHVIAIEDDGLVGAADKRREGTVLGR